MFTYLYLFSLFNGFLKANIHQPVGSLRASAFPCLTGEKIRFLPSEQREYEEIVLQCLFICLFICLICFI